MTHGEPPRVERLDRLSPRWPRMILKVITLGALIYLGFGALMYLFQDKIIFPASRGVQETPASYGWAFEELRLPVMGETTHGWYLPTGNARGVILFSHGNGGNASGWLAALPVYRRLGFSVLLYDYGGYGASTGKPSETRCYADIRAMWNWLVEEKKAPPERIVLVGRSLGGAVTADLAAEVTPAAVILESTFLSAIEMARVTLPLYPASWLMRRRFETDKKIARFTAPVLICHSASDEIIPFDHGKALFELAPGPKQFLEIRYGHNEGYFMTEETYQAGLEAFLGPLLPPVAPANAG